MISIVVAVAKDHAPRIRAELEEEGAQVLHVCDPVEVDETKLEGSDSLVVSADAVTRSLVEACDRARVRIIALGDADHAVVLGLGLPAPLDEFATGGQIIDAITQTPKAAQRAPSAGKVIAVWGAHGAPGRTTMAIELAVATAAAGHSSYLIDADSYAPSVAMLLGLNEDAPGIAAACRRAGTGELDVSELIRLAVPLVVGGKEAGVLPGLNRPSRWPELAADRLSRTLQVCREAAAYTFVDVAAATESDEELSFDHAVPRRNAAAIATLQEADVIVAVASADPLGIARFLAAHNEVRALASNTPLMVIANRVRSGPLGLDARGQIRRTLARFAGISEVHFVPADQSAADAALLQARPIADVAKRSSLTQAVKQIASNLPATVGS